MGTIKSKDWVLESIYSLSVICLSWLGVHINLSAIVLCLKIEGANELMYIPNDDTHNYPFCRLKLVAESFGHSSKWTNQSKFNKSPQGCKANE